MKNLFMVFSLCFALLLIPACALVSEVQEQSVEEVSSLIENYCKQTNEQFRLRLREEINLKLNGIATIKVECIQKQAVKQNQNFERMPYT